MISDVEHLHFMYLLAISISYVEKGLRFFAHFKNQIICGVFFFAIELYEFLKIHFGYESLIGHVIYKYFLLFHMLPFNFLKLFFCCAEAF